MAMHVPKEPSSVNPEDLYENFLQKSLGELKDYLSLRGLNVTGKKRELVTRAFLLVNVMFGLWYPTRS